MAGEELSINIHLHTVHNPKTISLLASGYRYIASGVLISAFFPATKALQKYAGQ